MSRARKSRRTGGWTRFQPEMEALDDRLLPSGYIPVNNHRDLIFDDTRGYLYITTANGRVERWDASDSNPANHHLLAPFTVGTSLYGGDTTPDDAYLYVAEDRTTATQGFFHKVDLVTGSVIDVPYALGAKETGAWDIVITSTGSGLATTAGTYKSSESVKLRQLNLADDTFTNRLVVGFLPGTGSAGEGWTPMSQVARSSERNLVFVHEGNGNLFAYDPFVDNFSPYNYVASSPLGPAVNHNGTLVAYQRDNNNLIVLNANLSLVRTLGSTGNRFAAGGHVFDPIRDILYAVSGPSATIVAYDTNTWATLFSLPAEENIADATNPFSEGTMAVSGDGKWLFLATPSGVREYDLSAQSLAGIKISPHLGNPRVIEGGSTGDWYTVALTRPAAANVIVTLTPDIQLAVSGPTVSGMKLTFTPGNWANAQTVTVTAIDDFLQEGGHWGLVRHTASSLDSGYDKISINSVNVEIIDNDLPGIAIVQSAGTTNVAEGGVSDDFSVVLNTPPTGNVTVTMNPVTQVMAVPNVLTFTPANWSLPQAVLITAIDDAVGEGPHNGVVSFVVTTTDSAYNGLTIAPLTASIIDNDLPGVTVTPSGGSTSVTEAGSADTCSVVLNSMPAGNVVITFSPDTQVAITPPLLTFTSANWNIAQTITVTATNDFITEGNHVGVISLAATSTDPNYSTLTVPNFTANIIDDDIPGIALTPSGASTDVVEGGGPDNYTVALLIPPTANVIVTLAPGSQLIVAPATLTFTPANWNVPQAATVTAIDNLIAQGSRVDTVSHVASSSDANYNGLILPRLVVNITDNEFAGIALVPTGTGTGVAEGGTGDTYSLALVTQPTSNVLSRLL